MRKRKSRRFHNQHVNNSFFPLVGRIRDNFYFLPFVDLCFLIFFHKMQVLIVYKMLSNSLQVLRASFTKTDKVRYPIFHHQHTYIIWFCLPFSYLILIQGEASWNSSKPHISKHIFVICHSSSG